MKLAFALLIIVVLASCSKARTVAPSSDGAGKMVNVYFQGTGSDQEVRRFQKILEVAFDDNHLQRVDSSRDADSIVKATITRQSKTTFLHVPRVLVTVVSRDNKKYEFDVCNGIGTSETIYSSKVEYVNPFDLPQEWTQAHPHFAVYIDESKFTGFEGLIASFEKRLVEKGYKIATGASVSDGELSSIKMQRLEVPMRVMDRLVQFEVVDKDSSRYFYHSGEGVTDVTYLGVEPPLKREALPCRNDIKNFSNLDRNDGSWHDARAIAQAISDRMGGTAVNSSKTVVHSN